MALWGSQQPPTFQLDLRLTQQAGSIPVTENVVNILGTVKSYTEGQNLLPLLCQSNIISYCILNIMVIPEINVATTTYQRSFFFCLYIQTIIGSQTQMQSKDQWILRSSAQVNRSYVLMAQGTSYKEQGREQQHQKVSCEVISPRNS